MTRDEFFRARLTATKLPPGKAKGSGTPRRPVKSKLKPGGTVGLEWCSTRATK